MIIYTDKLIPPGFDAHAWFAPFILVRPHRRGDEALIAHERRHAVDAWLCGWLVCGLLYLISKRFRCWFEVRGYREEIKIDPGRREWAAQALANDYRLGISAEKARDLLK